MEGGVEGTREIFGVMELFYIQYFDYSGACTTMHLSKLLALYCIKNGSYILIHPKPNQNRGHEEKID